MGREYFYHVAEGNTAEEAFEKARDEAFWDYGHAGYTGTIAEKDLFEVVQEAPLSTSDAESMAESMADDPRVEDKGGPAGAIPIVFDTREVAVAVRLPPGQLIGAMDDQELKAVTGEALGATESLRDGEFVQSAALVGNSGPVRATVRCEPDALRPESLADCEPQGWLFFGWAST